MNFVGFVMKIGKVIVMTTDAIDFNQPQPLGKIENQIVTCTTTNYLIHQNAQEFAERKLEEINYKVQRSSGQNSETMQVTNKMCARLIEACEQVIECRRLLKYTYVFAYQQLHQNGEERDQIKI
jgi:hypothetical protein